MVVTGTRSKKAEPIGVDGVWQSVPLEGFAEVLKVVPSGVTFDEAACDVEPGAVVDGEEQGLFARSGPPLMDGAVVLPEFSNVCAPKAAICALFGRGCGH